MSTLRAAPGWRRWERTILVTAVLALMVLGAGFLAVPGQARAAATGSPVGVAATPLPSVAHAPAIASFSASPSGIPQGGSTFFDVQVSPDYTYPYYLDNYSYLDLPYGCTSSNTSFLFCAPASNVSGKITVTAVVENVYNLTATAKTTLDIFPGQVLPLFAATQSFADPSHVTQPCSVINAAPFYTSYCQQELQSPSFLNFSNGSVGVAYSVSTTASGNSCSPAGATRSQVGVTISTNGGLAFSTPTLLGDSSCTYLNAIEPSFTVSSTGTAYGVFIEENSNAAPGFVTDRSSDALGFVSSTNNGSTWSASTNLVSTGNLARPAIATYGSSIYVVYEDIANSTNTLPGGGLPISVQFVSSTDGGSSWSIPQTLPGLNASQYYNAMSPSIAVAPSGAITVAYATNRSCLQVAHPSGSCLVWGDSVVTVSSTNGGSSWAGPTVVRKGVGETSCPLGACYGALFESTPETAVAYSPTGGHLTVAFAGTYSAVSYQSSGVWAATNSTATSWTVSSLGVSGLPGTSYANPTLATNGSGVVAAFTSVNENLSSGLFPDSFAQWASLEGAGGFSGPSLVQFDPMPSGVTTNITEGAFIGFSSAIGFNASGSPLVAYDLPQPQLFTTVSSAYFYYANYTTISNLSFAFLTTANGPDTTTAIFETLGLAANSPWYLNFNQVNLTTTLSGIYILNVPTGLLVPYVANSEGAIYGAVILGPTTFSVRSPVVFTTPMTITITFDMAYQLEIGFNPYFVSGTDAEVYGYGSVCAPNYGCTYSDLYVFTDEYQSGSTKYIDAYTEFFTGWGYYYTFCYGPRTSYTCTPYSYYYGYGPNLFNLGNVYVPFGFNPTMYTFQYPYPTSTPYINGTGTGSYTGPAFPFDPPYEYGLSFSVQSPINETYNFQAASGSGGVYNETFFASGLPTGTPYHFTWNGTQTYNGTSPSTVNVPSQTAGAYPVSNVWANGSTPGWEYFGAPNPNTHVVVPYEPVVNLSYSAYEDVGAVAQPVTFQALNLTAGTPWSLSFNGTIYSSDTPWINLTVHPGTYPTSVGTVVASTGEASYGDPSYGPSISIAAGQRWVNISFGAVYEVTASASTGGSVSTLTGSPTATLSQWLAPGQQTEFVATAQTGWNFAGWSGSGAGSYTGNNTIATVTADSSITESASFSPMPDARFNLTFLGIGLPARTWWGVALGGHGYSTDLPTMTVGNLYAWPSPGLLGHYSLAVPYVYLNSTNQTRYAPVSAPAEVGTNGTTTLPVQVVFAPQQLVSTYASVGGVSNLVQSGVPQGGSAWAGNGTSYQLVPTASPGYKFVGWTGTGAGSYTGNQTTPTISVSTSPITEFAEFVQPPPAPRPTYSLTVNLGTSIATGTSWSFVLANSSGAKSYSSTGVAIVVPGLVGKYTVTMNPTQSPDGLAKYAPIASNTGSVTLTKDSAITLDLQASYWVEVESSAGGSVLPGSGWQLAGTSIQLQAQPFGTNTFLGWKGSGSGNYTGDQPSQQIVVDGPITEIATFSPTSVAVKSTSTPSVWENPAVLAGLAVVGLVIGLIIGLVVFRRRGGSSGGMPPAQPYTPATEADRPAHTEDGPGGSS